MRAIGVSQSKRTVRLIDHPEPQRTAPDHVKIRILEVGVCGTDREICEFKFGEPPPGSEDLVLGHEALGEVVEVGAGPVGLLGAMAFLLRGCKTTVVARSPGDTANARLATAVGATYVSSREVPLRDLGAFDVIYEAAGSPAAAFESLSVLAPNGVGVLTGVSAE